MDGDDVDDVDDGFRCCCYCHWLLLMDGWSTRGCQVDHYYCCCCYRWWWMKMRKK